MKPGFYLWCDQYPNEPYGSPFGPFATVKAAETADRMAAKIGCDEINSHFIFEVIGDE